MRAERLIDSMERFCDALPALVHRVSVEDARWRPEGGGWSILEIVTHLADEEAEDFRMRLRLTLEDPAQPWPPIDPEGVAVERRYNDGDLGEVLGRLSKERRDSVAWLRGLGADVDWEQAVEHPSFGSIRAGDLLGAWAAHDSLHLRQIAKRLYQLIGRDCGTFRLDYAGTWTV